MSNLHLENSVLPLFGSMHLKIVSSAIVLMILLAGCDIDRTTSHGEDLESEEIHAIMDNLMDKKFDGGDSDLLKSVMQATARYHSTTQAARAGYEAMGHCVENPELGGMGYHWVNQSLIDPAFNPVQPEALLYEPDKNGNLKLVGVEYIVINVGQDRPYFGDYPFDVGGVGPLMDAGVPHWSLHVWLYKENPNGLFVPFNPNVTCY